MHLIVHPNPDEAVKLKCKELERIRKKEGRNAYLHYLRIALKTDPWFAMRVALEWAWLDEDLVGHKLIKHVADNYGEDTAILLPRGHGKTLPMAGMLTTFIVNNPDIAILEISRTEDNANKFGGMVSDILMYNDMYQECFGRKHNPVDGVLPSATSECREWGKEGYTLPYRRTTRLDPTLLCNPLRGAKAGKHPDIIYLDDLTERENNHEQGWSDVKDIVHSLWYLLPPHGHFIWTATRWHDSDPIGMAYKGALKGKQGPFKFLKMSCYEDDNPSKSPIYPSKKRWTMTTPTGYTHQMLEDARNDPEFGAVFDAQMRNDPSPSDRATIDTRAINIYEAESTPQNLDEIRVVGVEITGGGLPIYEVLKGKIEELHISMPIEEVSTPKKQGVDKADRIIAALQPIVNSGRLHVRPWMMGKDTDTDTLQYELKRIRVASHDDIADALHNVPVHLAKGITPARPEDPLHVYMSVDLAWSDKKRSDFTVAMIVAVDHRANYWVLDYDRFKSSSPEAISDRLVKFYQKWNAQHSPTQRQAKRSRSFACRY